MKSQISLIVLLWSALASAPAFAHHSRAMYDNLKTIELTGVVKEFQFIFPHSWLMVDVADKSGKTTTWAVEAAGPPSLTRSGIHKGDLPPGTKVTIKINPLRNGQPRGLWQEVIRLSDQKVFIEKFGGGAAPRTAEASKPQS